MTHVVRAANHRLLRWANGLGWTREIVRVPDGVDWDWRLSVAVSLGAASFSELHGVDRELELLRGVGLILRFAAGEGVVRNRSGIARSWTADEPFEALELEVAIARNVRDYRTQRSLSIVEPAALAGISKAML